jgi:hypothetical protein
MQHDCKFHKDDEKKVCLQQASLAASGRLDVRLEGLLQAVN